VQLSGGFTFRHALEYVDYWHSLGITDLYCAPFFVARPGSVHGYDVVDPRAINPEIGTKEDLARLHEALTARGMGILMDLVPNHMCVNTNDNAWWNDVLENGPSSPFAKFFDIDWRPPKAELKDKVLLPVLGDQYGKVLESAELEVREARGALTVHYYDRSFPIGPGTYPLVLEGALRRLREGTSTEDGAIWLLEGVIALSQALPARSETEPGRMLARQRSKELVKSGLTALLTAHPEARRALDGELRAINRNPATGHFWFSKTETIYETDDQGNQLWKGYMGVGTKGYAVWWREGGGAFATTGEPATIVEVNAVGAQGTILTTTGGQTVTVDTELYQIPLFVRVGSTVNLGDLNHEYQESLAIAQKKPDLKALDAEVAQWFTKKKPGTAKK